MKTKFHASKFKILFTLAITLVITSVSWLYNPMPVYADANSVLVEGYSADSDITSSDGVWYSTYCKGTGYKGQGLLLYLIDYNTGGPIAGTQPVAFACDPVMKTYSLHAQDKYNRYPEVTTWQSAPIYWKDSAGKPQGGGLIKSSTRSNLDSIKAWLTTKTYTLDGKESTKGIDMVEQIWGPDIAKRFASTEPQIVLVVEPIVAVQFAQGRSSGFLDNINDASNLEDLRSAILAFQMHVDAYRTTTAMSQGLSEKLSTAAADCRDYQSMPGYVQQNQFNIIKQWIIQNVSSDKVYSKNYPEEVYCGTPKRILDFYNTYTPKAGYNGETLYKTPSGVQYYKRAAHQAAYIKKSTKVCEFAIPQTNLWPDNKDVRRLHTDSDIRTKSIGMFAMLAWTTDTTGGSDQTTCDEPKQPTPHPAPNESTGSCTIIKSYRTKTATGLLTDPSTHTKDNTSPQILIEDEEEYKVIGWKISTTRDPHIDARYWETTVPGNIYSAGTTPSSVQLPDSHKVLYV